jgi:mono/diheme cytochrome c family protein
VNSPVRLIAITMIALFPVTTALAQNSGSDTYKAKCAMCHAADGSGNTPAGKATKTPSFNSPEMLKIADADFVADTKYGRGKMPAYSRTLTDPQIKDVIVLHPDAAEEIDPRKRDHGPYGPACIGASLVLAPSGHDEVEKEIEQ